MAAKLIVISCVVLAFASIACTLFEPSTAHGRCPEPASHENSTGTNSSPSLGAVDSGTVTTASPPTTSTPLPVARPRTAAVDSSSSPPTADSSNRHHLEPASGKQESDNPPTSTKSDQILLALERSRKGTAYVLILPTSSDDDPTGSQDKMRLDRALASVAHSEIAVAYNLPGRPGVFANVTSSGLATLTTPGAGVEIISSKIEPAVHRELLSSTNGLVDVLILVHDDIDKAHALGNQATQAKSTQARVLARLAPTGFQTGWVYEGVSALTGRATESSLELLTFDPDVAKVGYNVPVTPYLDDSVPFLGADYVNSVLGYAGGSPPK